MALYMDCWLGPRKSGTWMRRLLGCGFITIGVLTADPQPGISHRDTCRFRMTAAGAAMAGETRSTRMQHTRINLHRPPMHMWELFESRESLGTNTNSTNTCIGRLSPEQLSQVKLFVDCTTVSITTEHVAINVCLLDIMGFLRVWIGLDGCSGWIWSWLTGMSSNQRIQIRNTMHCAEITINAATRLTDQAQHTTHRHVFKWHRSGVCR